MEEQVRKQITIDPCFVCQNEVAQEGEKFYHISTFGNICVSCHDRCENALEEFRKEGWTRIETFINKLREDYKDNNGRASA